MAKAALSADGEKLVIDKACANVWSCGGSHVVDATLMLDLYCWGRGLVRLDCA